LTHARPLNLVEGEALMRLVAVIPAQGPSRQYAVPIYLNTFCVTIVIC